MRAIARGDEQAIGFGDAATDATAELMQLSEPVPVRVENDHDRSIGHVDADFDHGRGE